MAVSVTLIVAIISLHLFAFVFAIGAERCRSLVIPNPIPILILSIVNSHNYFFCFEFLSRILLLSFRQKWFPMSTTTDLSAFTPPTLPLSTVSPPALYCSSVKLSFTPLLDVSAAVKVLSPVVPLLVRLSSLFSHGNVPIIMTFSLKTLSLLFVCILFKCELVNTRS